MYVNKAKLERQTLQNLALKLIDKYYFKFFVFAVIEIFFYTV